MPSDELKTIRREAFLRVLCKATNGEEGKAVPLASLAQDVSLNVHLLGFLVRPLVSEGLVTVQGASASESVALTKQGASEANGLLNKRPSHPKTKILCIDTEPEITQRLKETGFTVFNVSMGYRTGQRAFSFPAPNEVNLIVCDLRRPACFDSRDWGPGKNSNFGCKIVPYEQVNNSFYVRDKRRIAQHSVIYETQLAKQIPGTFGSEDVKRAIVEGGIPFLLFLNEEWLNRIQIFPNWFGVNWSFVRTSATQVDIAKELTNLLPELGNEIRFKLAIQNRIEKGPLFGFPAPTYPTSVVSLVRNNIGDSFGQLVKMGKGSAWLIPATHQNVEIIELFALRLEKVHQDPHIQPTSQRAFFSREDRVRLIFLLRDLLPPPEPHSMGGEVGGEEMWELHELLQRALGRLEIGGGDRILTMLGDFINRAPEDELLTMLELMPLALERGVTKRKQRSPYGQVNHSDKRHMLDAVNGFLETIGAPARFDREGRFTRDGFADQIPAELKALPGREELQSAVARLAGETIAVIYFDLDNFKSVNDTGGHSAGDACLATVAEVVGNTIAQKGKLYRYGGDEFVVVLRNFSTSEASATAERIRTAIQQASPGGEIKVTTSIGVAATDMESIDRNRLIQAADVAMYQSKRSSKNCVTVWIPSTGYAPPKDK